MTQGIKIAKPTHKVSEEAQNLYVDSDTPLFKTFLTVSGSLVSDGTSSAIWTGQYVGTTANNGASGELIIPHNLGYSPASLVYFDLSPGFHRQFTTNFSGGVGTAGALSVGSFVDSQNLYINYFSTGGFTTPPAVGTYGFYIYIFYDGVDPNE